MKEIKMLYSTNNFNQILESSLDELKYAGDVLVAEFIKNKLTSKTSGNDNDSKKGVVIDVTEE
jgi:hypothetical protein